MLLTKIRRHIYTAVMRLFGVTVVYSPIGLLNLKTIPESFGFRYSRFGNSGVCDRLVVSASYELASGQWFYEGGRFFKEGNGGLASLGMFSVSKVEFLSIFGALVDNQVFSRPWKTRVHEDSPVGGSSCGLVFYCDGYLLTVPSGDLAKGDKHRSLELMSIIGGFCDKKIKSSVAGYSHRSYEGIYKTDADDAYGEADVVVELSEIEECESNHFFHGRHYSVCPFCNIGR